MLSPAARIALKKKKREYMRRWRHPAKTCVKCHLGFPNDEKNFSFTRAGRLSRICLSCAASVVHPAPVAGPPAEYCPMCQRHATLVRDTRAPVIAVTMSSGQMVSGHPRLCRPCLMVLAQHPADTLARLHEYSQWRASAGEAAVPRWPGSEVDGVDQG